MHGTVQVTPIHRRTWLRALPVIAMVAVLLPVGAGEAAAQSAGDAFCRGMVRSSSDLFTSHAEVRARLDRIERNSAGRVEVEVAGHSYQGRAIWTARVGHGDQVLLVQSAIHGNEKHGTEALLDIIERLGADTPRAARIRDEVTLVAMPMVNPDGNELNQRRNGMTWAQTVEMHPHLAGARPPWYFNANQGGYDLNRDFHADLDYEAVASDLPGSTNDFGRYLAPESRTIREVYRDLEDEFGKVHVFVDLHNQGTCYRHGPDVDRSMSSISYLSLTASLIDESRWEPLYPDLDFDASRRANVAIYDALQTGGSGPLSRVTLYPQHFDDPGTAHGSFAMRGSAVVLFETNGQTQSIGHQRMRLLSQQVDMGVMGLIDALVDGTFDDIDPERYHDIPPRTNRG